MHYSTMFPHHFQFIPRHRFKNPSREKEPVAKFTLANAMNRRTPSIFEDLFNELLDRCAKLAP